MARSVRERVLGVALATAREALEVLEARVTTAPVGARASLDRTREVLERDRALVESAPPVETAVAASAAGRGGQEPAAVPAEAPAEPEVEVEVEVECSEPIRTRYMAKLLAAQGYPHRALAIYRYLLAHEGGDPALHAEIAALQAHLRALELSAARAER